MTVLDFQPELVFYAFLLGCVVSILGTTFYRK